jgi:type III restriction enzyme
MPLDPNFPTDPLAILDPSVRWYPGDQLIADVGRGMLIPPLVENVRQGVSRWRASG